MEDSKNNNKKNLEKPKKDEVSEYKQKSQEELFRAMMVKEMLHKIEDKLQNSDNDRENIVNTIKQVSDESAFIAALKKIKNK